MSDRGEHVSVHLIAGFLGVGKTSAVRGLLERLRGERVALVVNDFGTAGVDLAILGGASGLSREIRGGCLCCTAPEGFVAAIGEILEAGPDRILVEPTGLARPADLIDTLRRSPHRDKIQIGPVIVLVDPSVFDPESPLHVAQVEAADLVAINRIDLADPEAVSRCEAALAGLWPPPRVIRTTFGALPDDALAGEPAARGFRLPNPASAGLSGASVAGYEARSRVWGRDVRFGRRAVLSEIREEIPRLARFKAFLNTDEGPLLLDVAGGVLHERPAPRRGDSRADAIGADGRALDRLLDRLSEAQVGPAHQGEPAGASWVEVVHPDGSTRVLDRDALAALPDPVPDAGAAVPGRKGIAARMSEVLGSDPGSEVVVVASDGMVAGPVPRAALRDALLVHTLGGGPLPAGQGGPFRLLVPGGEGGPCANVKGVARIVLREPA